MLAFVGFGPGRDGDLGHEIAAVQQPHHDMFVALTDGLPFAAVEHLEAVFAVAVFELRQGQRGFGSFRHGHQGNVRKRRGLFDGTPSQNDSHLH